MGKLTLIETREPETVGKTFYMKDGKLMKQAVADVWTGIGRTVDVPDAGTMAKLLGKVTSANNLVLVNGVFRGAGTEPFVIVTGRRFRRIVEADGEDFQAVLEAGAVYTIKTGVNAGYRVAARLKAMQDPSDWLLLDADEPPGFPDAWRGLSFQQRLELLESVAPGISKAERVELLGSSARVIREGEQPGAASHGWVRVSNAGDVARAATALIVHAVANGIYFDSPRHDRTTGEVIGAQAKTSIDLAPWHRGRLNFDSLPIVKAEGYVVADPGITIANPGGGTFDPGGIDVVKPKTIRAFKKATGLTIVVSNRDVGPMATVYGQLTMETPIEAEGETKPLRDWVKVMEATKEIKRRCEAPFRASTSEAAFISFNRDGSPFVYDIGTYTKYCLAPDTGDEPDDAADDHFDLEVDKDTREVEADVSGIADPETSELQITEMVDATEAGADPEAAAEIGHEGDAGDHGQHDLHQPAEGEADTSQPGQDADPGKPGGDADGGAGGDDGDGDGEDDEVDPNVPLTVEDVKKADITTAKGVKIVDTYREQQLKKLNAAIGYVVVEGKGVIVRVGYNGIGELAPQFIGLDAERNRLANRLVPFVAGGKEPYLSWKKIFGVWLEWSGRRTYDGIVFNPKREVLAQRRLPPYSRSGLAPLDLFVGTAWAAEPGECRAILQHIHEVLCGGDKEGTTYTLNWFARMVQQPQFQAETVLVFRSGQGIGKGTITNIFRRYFGAHGLELTNEKDLTGFNDHLATSIFVSLNEAVWGGNKQAEGTLKSLITEREIVVERKYLPVFKIRNHSHLVVSSNSDWAVPIGHDDRRFAAMNPSDARKGDMDYFNHMNKVIVGGGDKALIHYLLNRDISQFNPRKLPAVSGSVKFEQKIRSANSVAKWLHGVLADNGLELEEEDSSSPARNRVFVELDNAPITKAAFYEAYVKSTRGGDYPETLEMFSRKLYEILGSTIASLKVRNNYRPTPRRVFGVSASGTAQVPCFGFVGPQGTREAFEKYMGEKIEWR